jgi:hypothetical protein
MAEGSFSWPFWLLILTFDIDAVTGIDVMAVDGLMLLLSLYSQVSHTLIYTRIVVDRLTVSPHVLFRIKIASRPTPSSSLRIPPET